MSAPKAKLTVVVGYMQEVSRLPLAVPPDNLERIKREMGIYMALGRDGALQVMSSAKLADFSPVIVRGRSSRELTLVR